MCKMDSKPCVYAHARPCGQRDTCNRVRHVAGINWIEDVRKTMTHLPQGLFHTANWTEREKGLREKKNHQSSQFCGEMSKGAVSPPQMRIHCLSSQLNTVQPTSCRKERENVTLKKEGSRRRRHVKEEARQYPFYLY